MCESSFISAFVDDHSIFHIITSVGNDCNNSISSMGVLPEIVITILLGLDEWLLREKEAVNLIVHTIGMVMVRCAHCLFCHLALIHVTG